MNFKSTTKVFNITQDLINEAEDCIFNSKNRNKKQSNYPRLIELLMYWLLKNVKYPFLYISKGGQEFFKPFNKWLIFVFIIMMFFWFVDQQPFDEKLLYSFIILLLISALLVIFAVPSTYADYGVKTKEINELINYLKSLNIKQIKTIELIEENLKNYQVRINLRISAYKWFLASIWAVFTIFINISIKIENQELSHSIFINFTYMLITSLVIIVVIQSYKRASDLLIKTIEFSLVEMKHILHISNESENNKKAKHNNC